MIDTAEPVEVFFALSDANRLGITELLSENGPLNAGTIAANFEISAAAVSQHLRVLRQAGLVSMEKRGQRRVYSLREDTIQEVGDWLDRLRGRLQSRYDALERMLNEEE